MRQLIFTSLSFLLLTTNSTALASKAKISAKEFVAQAMNSNAQNTLSLIEHKGVSWFPKTQLRAERKGFDRKNNQTNSVGLRIYNSGLLSYSKKKKMSSKVSQLIKLSRTQASNLNLITYYEQYLDAYILINKLNSLNKKVTFLKAKKNNSNKAIDQLLIKEDIDDTLLDLQLTKEAINSWSENIKSLGLNIDIEQINSTSLITPKQALLNLKSSGATTTNNYFNKIQLEKDITQLDLDLQIDEQKKILDRLDISYDKKDDGDKVYSLSLTFNIPFLEGDIARNNFKNVRSNQKIQQLKKEALFAKFNSKKIINNFTFKSQKLQKDLNDIISLRKKVRSFKKNNFKMYKTLYEHLIKKQLRYFAHYREFIGLYLQQLNFSNVKLSTDNDYLKAM